MLILALALLVPQSLPVIERRRPDPVAQEAPVEAKAEAEAEPAKSEPEPKPEPMPTHAETAGEWRLGLARGGRSCVVRLEQTAMGFGLYALWQQANCPDGLFAATRWRLSGSTLELADRSGRALATLEQKDEAWQGKRASDGAALRLDRVR
jgi:hypothetical protein